MSRLDWDGAAKRDYVRDNGSIPYWAGLSGSKSSKHQQSETKTGKALAAKARKRAAGIVQEFAMLPPEAQLAAAEKYRDRVRRACADERNTLSPSKKRYAGVITTVEKQLLGEIKGKLKRAARNTAPAAGDGTGVTTQPATLLRAEAKPPRTSKRPGELAKRGSAKRVQVAEGVGPGKGQQAKSRFRDLPEIALTVGLKDNAIYVSWQADEEVEKWMLTVLSRRSGGAKSVGRQVFPADTTQTVVTGLNSEQGPFSIRLFGIGPGGPLNRGAHDGIKSGPQRRKTTPTDRQSTSGKDGKEETPNTGRAEEESETAARRKEDMSRRCGMEAHATVSVPSLPRSRSRTGEGETQQGRDRECHAQLCWAERQPASRHLLAWALMRPSVGWVSTVVAN